MSTDPQTTGEAMNMETTPAGDRSGQYLTFLLGKEEYGIPILKVQEIRGYSAITPIPNTPPWIKGVMNLRGVVVPVVGLREKFGMPKVDYDKFTVIIVLNVGTKVLGAVVDAVSDVLDLSAKDVETPPELGAGVDVSFLTGMAKAGERLIALLDVENALGGAEIGLAARDAA
jgi:purine-binding chemotaxis protein CheW